MKKLIYLILPVLLCANISFAEIGGVGNGGLNASTSKATITNAVISTLSANGATITKATITNGTSTNFFVTAFNALTAIISNLTASLINVGTINATSSTNALILNASTTNASTSNILNLLVSGSSTLASTTIGNVTTGLLNMSSYNANGSATSTISNQNLELQYMNGAGRGLFFRSAQATNGWVGSITRQTTPDAVTMQFNSFGAFAFGISTTTNQGGAKDFVIGSDGRVGVASSSPDSGTSFAKFSGISVVHIGDDSTNNSIMKLLVENRWNGAGGYGFVVRRNATTPQFIVDGTGYVGVGTTSATSMFTNAGSIALPIKVTATSYTMTANDYTVVVTATEQTITLPITSAIIGRIYIVKFTGSGSVTITPKSGTIDGSASDTISVTNQANRYQTDGINWYKI